MGGLTDTVLKERESLILSCVVEAYVQTAKPVGSRTLCKKFGLNISPATVRNVMNDLEENGFLCQPHVSAGRIPTDKGYRFYVDGLMNLRKLNKRELELINNNLKTYSADIREILDAASRVLGRISSQLGVVLEPRFYEGIFLKMELVSVSDTRIMAVISIESGLVKTIMMEIESGVSRDQLHQTSFLINERLSGLSLKEVKETIDERLRDASDENNSLIRFILQSSDRLFDFDSYNETHLGGTLNIVSNPEFADRGDVARILGLIENKENLLSNFHLDYDSSVAVSIGEENKKGVLQTCSVIVAPYVIGNVVGSLGVVGPTRMQYARIIPLVDYMGLTLTKMFKARGVE